MRLAFGSVINAELASFVGLPADSLSSIPILTWMSTRPHWLGMANAAVRAAAQARDPIALASKRAAAIATAIAGTASSTVGAALAAALAPYQAPATATAVTYVPWDGHIDRRCGPLAVALAPYHVREV